MRDAEKGEGRKTTGGEEVAATAAGGDGRGGVVPTITAATSSEGDRSGSGAVAGERARGDGVPPAEGDVSSKISPRFLRRISEAPLVPRSTDASAPGGNSTGDSTSSPTEGNSSGDPTTRAGGDANSSRSLTGGDATPTPSPAGGEGIASSSASRLVSTPGEDQGDAAPATLGVRHAKSSCTAPPRAGSTPTTTTSSARTTTSSSPCTDTARPTARPSSSRTYSAVWGRRCRRSRVSRA